MLYIDQPRGSEDTLRYPSVDSRLQEKKDLVTFEAHTRGSDAMLEQTQAHVRRLRNGK